MIGTRAEGAVTILTIERPGSANAIDSAVADGLVAGLRAAVEDAAVRAVVLTGAGERVFCAGVDLKEGREWPHAELAAHRAGRLIRCLDAMIAFPKPLVCAVNGVASGGGAMLAFLGDRVVAADNAAFVLPEIDLGMPSFIGLELLSWVLGQAGAADLILTGRRLSAAEAAARHAVAAAVPAAELLTVAVREAIALGTKPPHAVALVKAAIARERQAKLAAAIAETERVRPLLQHGA